MKSGISVLSLNFDYGDYFLKKDVTPLLYQKVADNINEDITASDRYEAENVNHLYKQYVVKVLNRNLSEDELNMFAKYISVLRKIIKDNQISCLVMQNDTRWQHAYAIHVAKQLKIKYWVFELGLFRPNTITMDCKGVNFNNSIERKSNFYENFNAENKLTPVYKQSSVFKRNVVFGVYLLLHKLSALLKVGAVTNKPLNISNYFFRFLSPYLRVQRTSCLIGKEIDYIFVPLQVNEDSQVLVHSPYQNMCEFIEDVINGVSKYRQKYSSPIKLVFKEHPMDQGKADYSKVYERYNKDEWIYFCKDGNTNELITGSKLIITINSTVGLEGIERNKKVLCMGNAFYAIEGLAFHSTSEKLADDINISLTTELNSKTAKNFIDYLRFSYSVEGNEYDYNDRQLDVISNKIISSMEL